MSVRIKKVTKIGNGKYISESYKPSEYFFIILLRFIFRFFIFSIILTPFYLLKLFFLLSEQ